MVTSKKSLSTANLPMPIPSGMATAAARANPRATRSILTSAFSTRLPVPRISENGEISTGMTVSSFGRKKGLLTIIATTSHPTMRRIRAIPVRDAVSLFLIIMTRYPHQTFTSVMAIPLFCRALRSMTSWMEPLPGAAITSGFPASERSFAHAAKLCQSCAGAPFATTRPLPRLSMGYAIVIGGAYVNSADRRRDTDIGHLDRVGGCKVHQVGPGVCRHKVDRRDFLAVHEEVRDSGLCLRQVLGLECDAIECR